MSERLNVSLSETRVCLNTEANYLAGFVADIDNYLEYEVMRDAAGNCILWG